MSNVEQMADILSYMRADTFRPMNPPGCSRGAFEKTIEKGTAV